MVKKVKLYSVLKVEITDSGQETVFVNKEMWFSQSEWGEILADIANAISETFADKWPAAESLESIARSFNAGLRRP